LNKSLNWGKPHSDILSHYLTELKKNEIKYFILRNYEELPYVNTSKDVDIIIDPSKIVVAENLLKNVFRDHNLTNYYKIQFRSGHRCCYGINLEKSISIHIDLMDGCSSKGIEIIPFDELYQYTYLHNEFFVLNELYSNIMLFLYKIIGQKKPKLKPEYKESIYNTLLKYPDFCIEIEKVFGIKETKTIADKIKNYDFDTIIDKSCYYTKLARIHCFKKNTIATTKKHLVFVFSQFNRVILTHNKHAKTIAFMAPDGAGKTTLIDGLINKLSFVFVADKKRFTTCHFRPTILPNLGAVGEKAKVMKQDTNYSDPHRNEPANPLSSLIRMTYYWIDYFIGVPLLLIKDAKADNFTFFDRYIYDFIIDPQRARINLPYIIRKTFSKLVVQPKIVFILKAPPELIYARKQELTLKEIEEQLCDFDVLKETNSRFIILDASLPAADVVNDATKIIVDTFTQKL
jgi:thymidylate kinase